MDSYNKEDILIFEQKGYIIANVGVDRFWQIISSC